MHEALTEGINGKARMIIKSVMMLRLTVQQQMSLTPGKTQGTHITIVK